MIEPSNGQQTPPASEPMRVEPVRVSVRMPASTPVVTYVIMGVTVAMFLLQQVSDLPLLLGIKENSLIIEGQYWRLITPVLLHGNWAHIGFNMYALFSFGPNLEKAYGHWRFLLLYLIGALAGNVASFMLTSNPSLGASTAIFGLVAAEGMYYIQNQKFFAGRLRSALGNIGLVIAINLVYGFTTTTIDNWGHLGGLVGGAIFAYLAGPALELEGLVPDLRLVDKRPPLLPWLVALVEAAALALIASSKIFR